MNYFDMLNWFTFSLKNGTKITPFATTQISYEQSKEKALFSKTKLINGFLSKLSLHYIYPD